MTRIFIKTVGSTRKRELDVPENVSYDEFCNSVAEVTGLPAQQLSLVLRGKPLRAGGASLGLTQDAKPKRPPAHVTARSNDEIEDDEDDDLKFELPPPSNKLQHAVARFLRERLHCPDLMLIVFFWFRLRTWGLILLWFCMAPVVHHLLDLGPIYILATCFALIFLNLGTRREGEASAYSIFNEGFRELPGTLNADRLDHDIRAGQF